MPRIRKIKESQISLINKLLSLQKGTKPNGSPIYNTTEDIYFEFGYARSSTFRKAIRDLGYCIGPMIYKANKDNKDAGI